MAVVDLYCKRCSTPILMENVNMHKGIAVCHVCSCAFDIEQAVKEADIEYQPRPEVFMPPELDVLKLRSELTVDIPWAKRLPGFLIFFTIIWNVITFFFVFIMLSSGESIIYMSGHIIAGLVLLYITLANTINTTRLTVNEHYLAIRHKPIPFYGNQEHHSSNVEQLHCEEYVSGTVNGRPHYAYRVIAHLKNNKKISLLRGLAQPEQALYIEQEIERFLQIKDWPVKGELWGNQKLK